MILWNGTLLLVMSFFVSLTQSYAQGFIKYYHFTSRAEWHYDNNRFDSVLCELDSAFRLVEKPKMKDVYLYSLVLAKKGKTKRASRFLVYQIKKRGGISWDIANYAGRDNINFTKHQLSKIDRYKPDTLSSQRLKNVRTRDVVDSLFFVDQSIRLKPWGFDSVWWYRGTDSVYVNKWKKRREIDSLNAVEIKNLIRDHGLIQNDLISDAYFGILLLHMDYDDFAQIEEELIQMIDYGNLDPWSYARAKDRKCNASGNCFKYFAYTIGADDLTCIDYDRILENRKEIGLSIYYSRGSFRWFIAVNQMMKYPLRAYYDTKINETK